MNTYVKHSLYLSGHTVRKLLRNPMVLALTLVQPVVWLLLFGQLFQRVSELPGFGAAGYITYLTPGVVIMSAMFSAGWSGNDLILDMERGVMDRYLSTPVSRGGLITATLAYQALVTLAQTLVILGLGAAMGARFAGGAAGLGVLVLSAVLVGSCFAGLSCVLALLVRQQEALIGINQFLSFPLLFLSSVLMAPALLPGWVGSVARYNPVDWAAVAARAALQPTPEWASVVSYVALLGALAVLMSWLATRAFKSYQRAV